MTGTVRAGPNKLDRAAVDGVKDTKTRPKLADKYEWVVPPSNRFDKD